MKSLGPLDLENLDMEDPEEVKLEITGSLKNEYSEIFPVSIAATRKINPGYLCRASGRKVRMFECRTNKMSEQEHAGLPNYQFEGGEQFTFIDQQTLFISGGKI